MLNTNSISTLLGTIPSRILSEEYRSKALDCAFFSTQSSVGGFILEYHILEDLPKVDFAARLNTLDIGHLFQDEASLNLIKFVKRALPENNFDVKTWLEYDLEGSIIPSIFFDLRGLPKPLSFFYDLIFFYGLSCGKNIKLIYLTLLKRGTITSFSYMVTRKQPELKVVFKINLKKFIYCLKQLNVHLDFGKVERIADFSVQTQVSVNLLDLSSIGIEFMELFGNIRGKGETLIPLLRNCDLEAKTVKRLGYVSDWISSEGPPFNRLCHFKITVSESSPLSNLKLYLSSSYSETH